MMGFAVVAFCWVVATFAWVFWMNDRIITILIMHRKVIERHAEEIADLRAKLDEGLPHEYWSPEESRP